VTFRTFFKLRINKSAAEIVLSGWIFIVSWNIQSSIAALNATIMFLTAEGTNRMVLLRHINGFGVVETIQTH